MKHLESLKSWISKVIQFFYRIITVDYLLYTIILNESKYLKKEIMNVFGEDFSWFFLLISLVCAILYLLNPMHYIMYD